MRHAYFGIRYLAVQRYIRPSWSEESKHMSLFHTRHNTGGRYADEVIIGGNVYSVSKLRGKARRLTMRMWASIAVTLLIAMTIVPYLAQAATNGNNSDAFSGTVIPGYSMGGVSVTAYGVDVNSWGAGKSDSGSMAKSNYGIWSGSRVANVSNDGTAATDMTADAKSSGWKSITGRQNYSATNPNGQDTSSTATDTVNPYRTASDSTYWDAQPASASAADAGITVSWLPEFICVGVGSDGQATVLTNPDDATSIASDQSMILKQNGSGYTTQESSAIPHYISLKDLFDAYGLNESKDTMTDLKNAMQKSKAPLNSLLDDSHNLLHGTSYSDLNGSTGESSDAFNPYPYTMVFTKTDNGKQVVSGIYENCEAYVYFSPQSMYQAYISLEQEYESIATASADAISSAAKGSVSDASLILTLGYYQAAMSICEAYLSEALPQDMTRGYVGPVETSGVSGSNSSSNGGDWRTNSNAGISVSDPTSASSFSSYQYATLMYDVANKLQSDGTDGSGYCLAQTNATMDTLSTFGYSVNTNLSTGVMKGMNAANTYNRMTAFTAYSNDNTADVKDIDSTDTMSYDSGTFATSQANTGIYVAPYYPIQQHCIPSSELRYRFSIVNSIPFQTAKAYLSAYGFGAGSTNLSYSSNQIAAGTANSGVLPTDDQLKTLDNLLNMFSEGSNDDQSTNDQYALSSATYDPAQSIVLNPSDNAGTSTSVTELNTQQRVDSALMNYANSSMTADNVHDLCDVIRSISGLKYETFMRYYNPLKSSGASPDIYLTRVSPANNTYMPTVLLQGYSAAGGDDITNGNECTDTAAFDYFSIPSFAACFAEHSASDCYYGALNYELRAFLQMGFLKTLSTGNAALNIPAVTAMEEAQKKAEQLTSKEIYDKEKMQNNLSQIFDGAQQLAMFDTLKDLKDGVTLSTSTLTAYIAGAMSLGSASDTQTGAVQAASIIPEDERTDRGANHWNKGLYGLDFAGNRDKALSWFNQYWQPALCLQKNSTAGNYEGSQTTTYNYRYVSDLPGIKIKATASDNVVMFWKTLFGGSNGGYVFRDDEGINIFDYISNISSEMKEKISVTFDSVDGIDFSSNTSSKANAGDGFNSDHWIWIKDDDSVKLTTTDGNAYAASGIRSGAGDYAEKAIIFSYLYKKHLDDYIGTNGDYYWTDYDTLRSEYIGPYAHKWTIFDTPQVDDNNLGANIFKELSDETNRDDAKNSMDEAADNVVKEIHNVQTTMQGLMQATPSQIQNAIGWADYVNSTNSQNAYQTDPSKATTTVIVNNNSTTTDSNDDQYITNISDANERNVNWDDDGGLSATINNTQTSVQGRAVAGLADTTSAATGQTAAYTISAIINRASVMSQQSVTYPYSGLATSSLIQGADRYAGMLSHVIDYNDISKNLDTALSNFKETEAVKLDWDTSAGDLDFDVLAQVKSLLGSLAGSIVQIGGNFFKAQAFPDQSSSSDVKFADDSVATGHAISNVLPSSSDNSYVTAINASIPNSSRTMIVPTAYDGTKPKATSSMSTASAASNNDEDNTSNGIIGSNVGTASVNFILNSEVGKNVYKFLQSVALLFVLISLIVIAFQNMLVYTTGSSLDFISAQTTLKRVLPRAVLAVFMIGLPPIGNGTGFQGGGFLLLEAINSIVRQIASVFSSIEGTGLIDMTVKAFQTGVQNSTFPGIILIFILAFIVCIMYFIGGLLVLFLNLFLFLFFLLTPLAWAAYVWPFDSNVPQNQNGNISGTVFQRITQRLGSKTFTGSKVGSEAAAGFVGTFVDVEIIYIIYVLMLWFASYIFVGTAGDQWMKSTNSGGDSSIGMASVLWLTLLNGLVIYLMGKLLMDDFHNTNAMSGMRNIANGVVNGIKKGAELASGVAAPIKAMDAANKIGNAVAAGIPVDGIDTRGALTKAIGDGSLEAMTGDGSNIGFAQQALKDASDALDGTAAEATKAAAVSDTADTDDALPKSESGAVVVHADNFDEKQDEPKTAGQVLSGSLKQLGQGLLDGDSKAVGAALGGMGTATQLAAADAMYDISSGNASLNPHLITKGKYALGTVLDAASTGITKGRDELAAGIGASVNAYDANAGVRQNVHAMKQSARAAKAGVREAYNQLNGALPANGATAMQKALTEEQKNIYGTHERNMQALAARAQADYAGTDKLDANALKEAQAAENARFFRAQQQFNNDERHAQLAQANAEQKAMLDAGDIRANMRRDENGNLVNGGEAIADNRMREAYGTGYDTAAASLQHRIDNRAGRANGNTVLTKQNRQLGKSDILQNGGRQAYRAEAAAAMGEQAAYRAQRNANMATARSVILDQADKARQNREQRALDAQRQERLSNDIATGKRRQQPAATTPASNRNAMPAGKPTKQAKGRSAADAYAQRQTKQRRRGEVAKAELEQKTERQKRYDDDLAAGRKAELEEGIKQRENERKMHQPQQLHESTANEQKNNGTQLLGSDGKPLKRG